MHSEPVIRVLHDVLGVVRGGCRVVVHVLNHYCLYSTLPHNNTEITAGDLTKKVIDRLSLVWHMFTDIAWLLDRMNASDTIIHSKIRALSIPIDKTFKSVWNLAQLADWVMSCWVIVEGVYVFNSYWPSRYTCISQRLVYMHGFVVGDDQRSVYNSTYGIEAMQIM